MESHTEQTRALVETVQLLAEAQTKQAEAFQRQLQGILDIWNRPIPERENPLLSSRDTELLSQLRSEARSGDKQADFLLNPDNVEHLEEYLSLFRES